MAAAFSLTGSLRLTPVWVEPLDASTVTDTTNVLISYPLQDGTDAGEANAYWRDLMTVAGGDTEQIDLTDLPMNVFGTVGSLDLATPKMVLVRNRSTAVSITAALGSSVSSVIGPGGFLFASSTAGGWAEDTLTLTNASGQAAAVEVYLVGVKA